MFQLQRLFLDRNYILILSKKLPIIDADVLGFDSKMICIIRIQSRVFAAKKVAKRTEVKTYKSGTNWYIEWKRPKWSQNALNVKSEFIYDFKRVFNRSWSHICKMLTEIDIDSVSNFEIDDFSDLKFVTNTELILYSNSSLCKVRSICEIC